MSEWTEEAGRREGVKEVKNPKKRLFKEARTSAVVALMRDSVQTKTVSSQFVANNGTKSHQAPPLIIKG